MVKQDKSYQKCDTIDCENAKYRIYSNIRIWAFIWRNMIWII